MTFLGELDLDPPSIHDLFVYFNEVYFDSCLAERCYVEWSSDRMTSCGGICEKTPGGAIVIRLSKPLLTLRPFHDTLDVLLHEMIHAEHFVRGVRDDDPTGHGTLFKAKMREINTWTGIDIYRPEQGYNITVAHSMIDEVNFYRKHHWVCGNCGDFVRRSSNRPPQKADCRAYRKGGDDIDCGDLRCAWHVHKKWCGGQYVKIAGDEADRGKRTKERKERKERKETKERTNDSERRETALDAWMSTGVIARTSLVAKPKASTTAMAPPPTATVTSSSTTQNDDVNVKSSSVVDLTDVERTHIIDLTSA